MYKIVNPESLTWVRGLPGPGQHGPWMSPITMAWDMSSIYQTVYFSIRYLYNGAEYHNTVGGLGL